MSADDEQQPAVAGQLARDAAGRAAQHLASHALTTAVAVVGAKAGLIVGIVIGLIVLILMLVIVIVSVAGAAVQSSTAVWPVSVKTATAGTYRASGWTISSRFGWRDDPIGGGTEFHDGLDLANPNGTCPFGYHCGAPTIFDGRVQYVGWDQAAAGDPSKTGGGELVIVQNGQQDHQTIYAHLEPYRLYVQLQGRIEDDYGRYDDYRDYQPIGSGPLSPDLSNGGIEMTCLNDMPNFIPTRSGTGTVVFMYDRPARCTTTVVWGRRGGDWQGWVPDQPGGGDGQRADLSWETPIDPGKHAQDVALRFRAHLVPPPPPPTPTDTAVPVLDPAPALPAAPLRQGVIQPGSGSVALGEPGASARTPLPTPLAHSGKPRACVPLAGGWIRCTWDVADIPSERERFASAPDPWIVAAQSSAITPAPDGDHADAEDAEDAGPTIPAALLLPTPWPPAQGTPTAILPTPTSTTTPLPAPAATQPLGMGGVARQATVQDVSPTLVAGPTGTAVTNPSLFFSGGSSKSEIDRGQIFQYTFAILSDSTDNRRVTFRLPLDAALTLLKASASGGGTCSSSDTTATCTLTVRQGTPATIAAQAMLKPDAPPGTFIRVVASAEDDLHTHRTAAVTVRGTQYQAAPTARPITPTATPLPAPTATLGTGHGAATLTPGDRQWVAPGGSARWTIGLAANARGFWSLAVTPSDPRLTVALTGTGGQPLDCRPTAAGLLCLGIPGASTSLQLSAATSGDSLGLLGDVTIAVGDSDAGGSGVVAANLHALIGIGDAPTATPLQPTARAGSGAGDTPNCAPLPLIRLPNVTAPQPQLVAPAAESFAAVRAEIQQRTGIDALAVLADVLRAPSFTTGKAGVLTTSWHKAGRAVDVNQGGPFVRVAEGNRFRLYINNVDITAIFEAHGWQRIPVQGTTLEWWHYEWHGDGIAWTSAMLQVWDLPTLQAAFPDINWAAIGCQGDSNTGSGDPTVNGQETEELCVLGSPSYRSAVETIEGCGPPVRAGDKVYQLDTTLGFVGLTGHTSGPHLHLGLKVKRYDGSWPLVNICMPEWLQGRTPPADANCYTDMADPLAFLPQAPGNATIVGGDGALALRQVGPDAGGHGARTPTPIIPEGAPYQLPPPNYPNSLVFTPGPGATPVGQYWSPYADGGQYGGGGVGQWFCSTVWSGFPWCN